MRSSYLVAFLVVFASPSHTASHKALRLMTRFRRRARPPPSCRSRRTGSTLGEISRCTNALSSAGLSPVTQTCRQLVEASSLWRASTAPDDPEGLRSTSSERAACEDRKLPALLRINGSRFDLVDEEKPFVRHRARASGSRSLSEGI